MTACCVPLRPEKRGRTVQPPHRTSPSNDTTGTLALLPSGYPAFDGTQPCAQVGDRDVFFPTLGHEQEAVEATTRICRDCPFQQPCGDWAVNHERHGIWAATTPRERNRIRRRRLAA